MKALESHSERTIGMPFALDEIVEPSSLTFSVATYGVTSTYARQVVTSLIERIDDVEQKQGVSLRMIYIRFHKAEHTPSRQPLVELTFTGVSGHICSTYLSFVGGWRTLIEDFLWVKRSLFLAENHLK